MIDTSFGAFFSSSWQQLILGTLLAITGVWTAQYWSWRDMVATRTALNNMEGKIIATLSENKLSIIEAIEQSSSATKEMKSQINELVTADGSKELLKVARASMAENIAGSKNQNEKSFFTDLLIMFEKGWVLSKDEAKASTFITDYLSLTQVDFSDIKYWVGKDYSWLLLEIDKGLYQVMFQVPKRVSPRIKLNFSSDAKYTVTRVNEFGFQFNMEDPSKASTLKSFEIDAEL